MKLAPKKIQLELLPPIIKPRNEDAHIQAARSAAVARTKAIAEHAKNIRFSSWDDLETRFRVQVPLSFKSRPCTYIEVLNFCGRFVQNAIDEVTNQAVNGHDGIVEDNRPVRLPSSDELGVIKIGLRTLKPRQKKCLFKIKHALFVQRKSHAVMLPLGTGTGKTIIAAAVIDDILKNNYYGRGNALGMWNIICIVPKATKIKFTREMVRCGHGTHLENDLIVRTYSDLNSAVMRHTFREEKRVNPYSNEEEILYKFLLGKPVLVIFDECHKLNNELTKTVKRAMGFINPHSLFLLMSATPAEVAQDLRYFALASQISWGGSIVDDISFKTFARQVGRGSVTTIECGEHTVKNIFEYYDNIASAIVNPPADPRKTKSINGVKLIEFLNERDREIYNNAQTKWLELCEKNGKSPDEWGQRLAAFGNFKQAAERVSVVQTVALAMEEFRKGRAVIIMTQYKETIKMALMELAKNGIPRSDISIGWGGEPKIDAGNCYDILTWAQLLSTADKPGFIWEDKEAKAKFNRSTKYFNTIIKTERTVQEQDEMDKWLKEMRLYKQSDEQLQDEVDNFQEGRTHFFLGTLARAGTGIDLDHQIEDGWPRTMLSFPCYNAVEFQQAFGRAYREFTITDVYQWVILLNGTIITEHVAPVLAKKLGSFASSTGQGLNLEEMITEAAARGKLKSTGETIDIKPVEVDEIIIDEIEEEEE